MTATKTVYENDSVVISTTGCENFVATIENKTCQDIILRFPQTDDFAGHDAKPWEYQIPANDRISLYYFEYESNMKQALEQGDFTISEDDAENE